jgi:hypothetical protein
VESLDPTRPWPSASSTSFDGVFLAPIRRCLFFLPWSLLTRHGLGLRRRLMLSMEFFLAPIRRCLLFFSWILLTWHNVGLRRCSIGPILRFSILIGVRCYLFSFAESLDPTLPRPLASSNASHAVSGSDTALSPFLSVESLYLAQRSPSTLFHWAYNSDSVS